MKKYVILFLLLPMLLLKLQGRNTDIQNNKISVTVNGQKISNNGIIYIENSPEMPKLLAKYGDNSDGKIIWNLKVIFKRMNRADIPSYNKTIKGNNTLDFNNIYKDEYLGGIVLIEAKDINGNKSNFTFNIRAKNPTEKEVTDYIGNDPWYAKAIAKHESGQQNNQYYCQFNEVGTLGPNYITNIKHTPNRSSDKIGWGLFQVTLPKPTHSELWSWKKNIDKGKSIIKDKNKLAQAYFNAVKRTFPDKYEAPPNYTPPECKTSVSAIDTATIQLYNGGSVLEALHNQYDNTSTYVSCWKFYPDNKSGDRWVFVPNRNEYVKRIINTYESLQRQ